MTWKKTWFSKIVWVCQFVITALFLTGVCGIFLDKYGITEKYNILPGYNRLMWLGIFCVLFFVVALLVFLLVRLIIGRIDKLQVKKGAKLAIEGLLFAGLIAGGVLYRLNIFPTDIASNAYYELAAVNGMQMPSPLAHGALYMYILLLHGLFLLVGNQLVAGIILQLVLQLIATCLIYIAVRRVAGVFPALWTLSIFMFAPTWVNVSLTYTPEVLYMLSFGIVLCVFSGVLKVVKNADRLKWHHYLSAFFFGICIAFMIYLDAVGVTLFVACISMLGVYKETGETRKTYIIPLFLIAILGAILGFLGIFTVDAVQSGSNLATIAGVWEWLFIPESGTSFSYLYHQFFLRLSDNPIVSVLVFAGLVWGIYGFFLDKQKESQSVWVLLTFSGIALSYVCPASGNMDRSILGLFGMIILAGKGVQITFTRIGKEEEAIPVEEEMPMEENVIAEETEIFEENPPVNEVKYIENPLPLPKKHVKKTMDYALEIQEDELEFDIEISEDDDFDF